MRRAREIFTNWKEKNVVSRQKNENEKIKKKKNRALLSFSYSIYLSRMLRNNIM